VDTVIYSARHEEAMKRSVLAGLSILAFVVVGQTLGAEPEHKFEGVYTGTKGKASAACPAEEDVHVRKSLEAEERIDPETS
jgi:hypothetical protein